MAGRYGDQRDREDRREAGGRARPAARADAGASAGVPRFLGGPGEAAEPASPAVFTSTRLAIQRAPADGAAATAAPPAPEAHAGPAPEAAAGDAQSAAPTPIPGMIVDDAAEPAAGQLRKSEFLALLRGEVCAAAEEALAGTLWSTVGCPYVDRWVQHYAGQDAASVEQALHRHVPEARSAASARDYIPLVAARVRVAVAQWTAQGEEGAAAAGEEEGAPGGGLISRFVGLFFKGRDGGGRADSSPAAVRARLGRGRSLDAGVGSRMSSALGRDFSRVRVHTDAHAARLSEGMQARAFTVGEHVAFGPGEYQPGTPVGDALIAHELAHVAQQEGASTAATAPPGGALEEEADRAAVGAVQRMWGGDTLAGIGRRALPSLRSGLRLQRCKSKEQKELERLGKVQYDYMEEKRKKAEEDAKKEAEKAAKDAGLPAPVADPKVGMGEIVAAEVKKGGFAENPVKEWTDLDPAVKTDWEARAKKAWNSAVASTKGTELETVVKDKSYAFEPETALKWGWYAWQTGSEKVIHYGMGWVRAVEADPRNSWPNIAHELGGHFEYGTTRASGIMAEMLKLLPEAERKKWEGAGYQKFFETYLYPETEIFSAVRERRYSNPETGTAPEYGSVRPDSSVPVQLRKLGDNLAPEVLRSVLTNLKAKIDAAPEILPRDRKFFVDQVAAVLGITL